MRNFFVAGTQVVMADGSTKPIEKVQPGDTVKATNAETGATEQQQVTATVTGKGDKELVELTLVGAGFGGGGPPAEITATAGHKFYSPAKGWIAAGDLKVGDILRDAKGRKVTVARTVDFAQATTVYNLTVDGIHTYYVRSGDTSVLVHNCGTGASQQATRLWVAGRPGVDAEPQDWIPMRSMITNGSNLQEGGYHYVVMPGGSVRAFNNDQVWAVADGAGHTSLSRGRPVAMAGTFDVDASGNIVRFDQFSGHYRPQGPDLEVIARDALTRNGFDVSGAQWDPW